MMTTVTIGYLGTPMRGTYEVGAFDRNSAVRAASKHLRRQFGELPLSLEVFEVKQGRLK